MRFIIISFLILFSSCSDTLDEKKITPNSVFIMSDNLIGTIVQSSNKDEIGKKISFIGLEGNSPKVLFESGVTSPLEKVFESTETVSLILIASGSGGIDGFVIDKKSGKFSRVSAGSMFGVYSVASLGICK